MQMRTKNAYQLLALALIGLLLTWSGPGFAAPPANPQEQNVPLQLTDIQAYLEAMEARLSAQMTDMEANLSGQMSDIEDALSSQIADVQSGVDGNSADLAKIYDYISSVNVNITTQLCMNQAVLAEMAGGAHGVVGAGWDEVLDVEANLGIDAGFGAEVGLGSDICIEIPLYEVTSSTPFSDELGFDTSEFDQLIGDVAAGAQSVIPVFAAAFTALAPTPEEAAVALENYVIAVTGKDLNGNASGDYTTADLLQPHVLLEPVIPDFLEEFAQQAPLLASGFAADPCGTLNSMSPFGQIIDLGDPNLAFMCGTTANALTSAFNTVVSIVALIYDIVTI